MQVNLAKGETCDDKHPVKASLWIKPLLECVKGACKITKEKFIIKKENRYIEIQC